MRNLSIVVLLVGCVLWFSCEIPFGTGTASGYVKNSTDQSAISGANVNIGGEGGTTDGSGYYTISNIPTGTQTIAVTASGYNSYSNTVAIQAGSNPLSDIFLTPSPNGGEWQLIYSTTFSSNPNWTTNNSSRFYWGSSDYTYYMENYENSAEYTYTATSWNSNSIKLEFDLEITQEAWGTHLGIGLYDANTSVNGNFLEAHFGHDDGGKLVTIFYRDLNGLLYRHYYGDFLLNTWYHFVLIYDKSTNSASLTVIDKATGNEFCTLTATGLSTFSGLSKLGFTNVGTTAYQTTIKGKIDNVNYYNWVE